MGGLHECLFLLVVSVLFILAYLGMVTIGGATSIQVLHIFLSLLSLFVSLALFVLLRLFVC